MTKRFIPDKIYDSVYNIEYDMLKEKGIKALIFDIDNTLATYELAEPDEKIKGLFKMLSEKEFKLYVLSNNNKERVSLFMNSVDIPHRWRALKPLSIFIRKAMKNMKVKSYETALIGDQIFTDVWGANRLGLFSVLVNPISEKEDKFVAFKRRFEKRIMK